MINKIWKQSVLKGKLLVKRRAWRSIENGYGYGNPNYWNSKHNLKSPDKNVNNVCFELYVSTQICEIGSDLFDNRDDIYKTYNIQDF